MTADVDRFTAPADTFRLGNLTTERSHPHTRNLSGLALNDLPAAVACLRDVDRAALAALDDRLDALNPLAAAMADTAGSGGRLFIGGCGATGRLAIALEVLAREGFGGDLWRERVLGFMAGGDAALVRSIEGFEDHPEYGARQLRELGFAENDLFIGVTEGGETPFVIGATEQAARLSRRPPWFLFCNPPQELAAVARSRRILEAPGIRDLALCCGPMALTGSTRMQASTVLMLAVGLAFGAADTAARRAALARIMAALNAVSADTLAALVATEASHYADGGHMLYYTDAWGVTVLTDTTERAPTFSLAPFENVHSPSDPPALSYLCLPACADAAPAWRQLLRRSPRLLEWPGCAAQTGRAWFYGFDISAAAEARRSAARGFYITADPAAHPVLSCGDVSLRLATGPGASLLEKHLLLKMVLNQHSTLVMGRMGRYQGNLMTYVRPANGKLIDRAARYVCALHAAEFNCELSYTQALHAVQAAMPGLGPDDPVVLHALHRLRNAGPASVSASRTERG